MNARPKVRSGCFVINPHDRISIRGKVMRLAYREHDGYVLMDADGSKVSEKFYFSELSRMNACREIKHEPDFFAPVGARRRQAVQVSRTADLTPKQKERLRSRRAIVSAFLEMQAEGLVAANDASIRANMAEICERGRSFHADDAPDPDTILREDEIRRGLRRRQNGGVTVPALAPVHPRTLRKWVAEFGKFGLAGLADSIASRGNRSSYFTIEERTLLMKTVQDSYMSSNRPTKANTFEDVKQAFHAENARRDEQGLTTLRVPSREAVRTAINGLDKFQVALARDGLQAAQKLFKPVGRGLEVERPFERVEMDEWKVDLITMMADAGLLQLFSAEELADLGLDNKRDRWWATVAIDCRTRCIVGMKLIRNPKTCSSIDCLRMVTLDKGDWADAVGALSGWPMAATPELLVTDNGAAFKAGAFADVCSDLGITLERTIAGLPGMRGTIERVFRTASQTLMHRLNGRTFSSALERGDHPSEARACLTAEDLCFALVRWIVDIYHNTPHEGLGGKTPLQQWEDDIDEGNFPLKASPFARDDRLAFGVPLSRQANKYGVTVLGVRYQSEMLATWFRANGKRDVDIRWLPDDIGAVEVRLNDEWHQLPAVHDGFSGLHAQEWLTARRSLRTSDPAKLKWREDTVSEAITAIRRMNTQRSLEFGLISQNWSPQRIADAEEALFAGFHVSGSEAGNLTRLGEYGQILEPSEPVQIEAPKRESPARTTGKPAGSKWKVRKGGE